MSRSWKLPQPAQVHWRTFNCKSWFLHPQTEQSCEVNLGEPLCNALPYHLLLYSRKSTSVPQELSLMDLESFLFLIIPFAFKSSMQTTWFLRTISVLNLCKKSFPFSRQGFLLSPQTFLVFVGIVWIARFQTITAHHHILDPHIQSDDISHN